MSRRAWLDTVHYSKKKNLFRNPLREGASDKELLDIIANAVKNKKQKHDGKSSIIVNALQSFARRILVV